MQVTKFNVRVTNNEINVIGKILRSSLITLLNKTNKNKNRKLLILNYHRVLNNIDELRPYETTVTKLEWQLDVLVNEFNLLPLEDAIERMYSNDLPDRAVSIIHGALTVF